MTLRKKERNSFSVHDELVFDVAKDEIQNILPFIKKRMEEVLELSVPLKVSLALGENWCELTEQNIKDLKHPKECINPLS